MRKHSNLSKQHQSKRFAGGVMPSSGSTTEKASARWYKENVFNRDF